MKEAVRSFLRRCHMPALLVPDPAGAPDMTDVFCNPPENGPRATNLLESQHFRVLGSRLPLAEGHVLIVPKDHIRVYGDIPVTWHRELEALITIVRTFQQDAYGRQSFAREQGSPPGSPGNRQSVRHAHFHLIPYSGSTPPIPDIPDAKPIRSFWDLSKYRLRDGYYHYIEVGGDRRVMPDDGHGVASAEWMLRELIGNVWDPVKLQPTKFEGKRAAEMYSDLCSRWNSWIATATIDPAVMRRARVQTIHKDVALVS